jgi:hypothetical protein
MSDEWQELAVFADLASAEVLAGLLRSESIDTRVVTDEPLPGLIRSCSVRVPPASFAKAREICSRAQLSEEEWSNYMDGSDESGEKQE